MIGYIYLSIYRHLLNAPARARPCVHVYDAYAYNLSPVMYAYARHLYARRSIIEHNSLIFYTTGVYTTTVVITWLMQFLDL